MVRALLVCFALAAPCAVGTAASAQPVAGAESARAAKAASQTQRDSVYRLYRAYFLREPSAAELTYWADRYANGNATLASISDFFARSNEFKNRYGSLTNAQFVDLVYQNVLGRPADAAGRAHWIAQLDKGQSRGSVMIGFSESGEFVKATGTTSPNASPWSSEQLAGITAVNGARNGQGLGSLSANAQAMVKAQRWAEHMAATGVLEHTGGGTNLDPSGISGWCGLAENVGYGATIESVEVAFMNSAIHRRNTLGSWTQVGIGVAHRGPYVYITQIFFRPC